MSKLSILAFTSALFVVPACQGMAAPDAAAAPTAATTATAPAASQADTKPAKKFHDPDEVICKRQEETGSRLGGKKVCMTRAEWDQQAADARDATTKFQVSHTNPQ